MPQSVHLNVQIRPVCLLDAINTSLAVGKLRRLSVKAVIGPGFCTELDRRTARPAWTAVGETVVLGKCGTFTPGHLTQDIHPGNYPRGYMPQRT